jgi:hypothetical protein
MRETFLLHLLSSGMNGRLALWHTSVQENFHFERAHSYNLVRRSLTRISRHLTLKMISLGVVRYAYSKAAGVPA